MSRRNIFLVSLLAVQVAIIAYVYRPASQVTSPVVHFFEALDEDQITGLTITDEQANSVVLNKVADDWQVGAEEQYPANAVKVEELLAKLAALESSRLVTRTRASQVRLKVSAEIFSRRIEVRDSRGALRTIYLGTSPSLKTIHVRLEGSNDVYLATGLSSWEASAETSSWWRSDYLNLDPGKVLALEVTNGNGTLALEKGEAEQWYLTQMAASAAGRVPVEQAAVTGLLAKITQFSLVDYLGRQAEPGYGLDEPTATALFRLAGGEEVSVVVGPLNEADSSHVLKASLSPFYVRVGSYAVKDLLAADGVELPTVKLPPSAAVPDAAPR